MGGSAAIAGKLSTILATDAAAELVVWSWLPIHTMAAPVHCALSPLPKGLGSLLALQPFIFVVKEASLWVYFWVYFETNSSSACRPLL
jgi:hypothetical protein